MKYLWNPLDEPVTTQYCLDEVPQTYTLPPQKITEFENEVIFNHMKKFLIEAILNKRDIIHFDENRAEVEKEVVKNI